MCSLSAPAIGLFLTLASSVASAPPEPELSDLVRLAEAARLADELRAEVWPGWEATSMPVLLVTAETEFLTGFPRRVEGFAAVGHSSLLGAELASRPRQFDPGFLATFPAFGPPALVVIGRAEATGKTSTEWVLTVLHENFHQFQMTDPGYFSEVEGLDLSGGDETGMWMLNYPFPYSAPEIAAEFAEVSRRLASLLEESSAGDRRRFWREYEGFLEQLSEADRRYFSFQVWQEGLARYVELRVAELAADGFRSSLEFAALPDAESHETVARRLRAGILEELGNPDLPNRGRVSFYAFGAGLGLLLDMDGASWKRRYLTDKFHVERDLGEE